MMIIYTHLLELTHFGAEISVEINMSVRFEVLCD